MKRNFGLWVGMCCCLPVCVWLAGTLHATGGPDARASLAIAADAVWRLQAMAILAFTPSAMGGGCSRAGLESAAMVILVPLPLLAVAWLGGAVAGLSVAKALAALLAGSALASMLGRASTLYLPTARCEPAIGLALAALALRYGEAGVIWLHS